MERLPYDTACAARAVEIARTHGTLATECASWREELRRYGESVLPAQRARNAFAREFLAMAEPITPAGVRMCAHCHARVATEATQICAECQASETSKPRLTYCARCDSWTRPGESCGCLATIVERFIGGSSFRREALLIGRVFG
ncbi:MAG TPA: hypothetical protein VFJ25_09175 [Casimicrobiaceae bacterium]|nr:hypothetical protein [Casimicrobiaceae bacterium]